MNSYFNTNHETGEKLKTSERKNKSQEKSILAWARSKQMNFFSTEDVELAMKSKGLLIEKGSVRRAISNLTLEGYFYKIPLVQKYKISRRSGKKIHCWM